MMWPLQHVLLQLASSQCSHSNRNAPSFLDLGLSERGVDGSANKLDTSCCRGGPKEVLASVLFAHAPYGTRSFRDLGRRSDALLAVSELTKSKAPLTAEALAAESPLQEAINFPKLATRKIRKGDYVVHKDFGVAIFHGVFTDSQGKYKNWPYLRLGFSNKVHQCSPQEAKEKLSLYKRKEQIEEFSAGVKLDTHTDFGASWSKRKQKATEKAYAYAHELVLLRAERMNKTRTPCSPDNDRMREFEAAFSYEPTPDQQRTFSEIEDDMCKKSLPMDRVVVGDVGFGKTEVAMRATYRMVQNNKQVVVLAPTTVLATQHYVNFGRRMKDVNVVLCSSMKVTAKAKKELHESIENGTAQVIIGTTAVLRRVYHGVGLLIIDEEQKYGVKQKEKILESNPLADVLSLSATPIPRTMYMCVAGIRELSQLHTPPKGRLPVKTICVERDNAMIMEAIKTEIARGGQVMYVVPRINEDEGLRMRNEARAKFDIEQEMDKKFIPNLENEVAFLTVNLPGVRITSVHGGQSKPKDLQERISGFILGDFDVLVATSLIENGIDIPNANTILVQGADFFGLSTLHQMRGRVGRSSTQAYCYLMTEKRPPEMVLADAAVKRLAVMEKESGLGSGHDIAKADMQIRGEGEVFGEKQKGESAHGLVGLDQYMVLLQQACKELEKRRQRGQDISTYSPDVFKGGDEGTHELLGLDDSLRA